MGAQSAGRDLFSGSLSKFAGIAESASEQLYTYFVCIFMPSCSDKIILEKYYFSQYYCFTIVYMI